MQPNYNKQMEDYLLHNDSNKNKRRQRRRGNPAETTPFSINDHGDVLLEVLKRLDARSLGVAACVCRLWGAAARSEAVWEHLCFRRSTTAPVRSVVASLGGYRRLYRTCVHPALSSLGLRRHGAELTRRAWSSHGAQLSLSLFCVHYYERQLAPADADANSLMFLLCHPVNV